MLKTLIGDADFRRGMDLYFERCDGTAATVEDFLAAFAEVTGRDLSHFARWYAQAGTPRVTVSGRYDEATPRPTGSTSRRRRRRRRASRRRSRWSIPVALGLVAQRRRRARRRDCNRIAPNGVFVLDRRPTASPSATWRRDRCRRCSAASRRR